MKKLENILNEKIKTLPENANIFVGYSGGDDSSALLHALCGLDEARKRNLQAININHQIHPNSDEWSNLCEENANKWKVGFKSVRVDVIEDGRGIEDAARKARYGVFEELFNENDYLITAHHMNDQAETFLMRALRGSGVDGLGAMREKRELGKGWLFRPMLGVEKKDIEEYIKKNNIQTVFDPSNLDNSLDRCFLRNEIIPLLEKKWPGAVKNLSASSSMSAQAGDLLMQLEKDVLNKCKLDENGYIINNKKLMEELDGDDVKIKRVLVLWMKENLKEKVNKNLLEETVKLFKNSLVNNDTKSMVSLENGVIRFWGRKTYFVDNKLKNNPPPNLIDGYTISYKNDNEKMKLRGRKFTQSFKKVMQDMNVPPWEREDVFIVKDKNDLVVQIGNYWIDDELSLKIKNRSNQKRKMGVKFK